MKRRRVVRTLEVTIETENATVLRGREDRQSMFKCAVCDRGVEVSSCAAGCSNHGCPVLRSVAAVLFSQISKRR